MPQTIGQNGTTYLNNKLGRRERRKERKAENELPGNPKLYFLWEVRLHTCPHFKVNTRDFFQSFLMLLSLCHRSESISKLFFDMCAFINPLIATGRVTVYSLFGVLAFPKNALSSCEPSLFPLEFQGMKPQSQEQEDECLSNRHHQHIWG